MLTRRHFIATGAALPLASTLGLPALAQTPSPAVQHHAVTLGSFQVASLLAGQNVTDSPRDLFAANVSDEEFARVSEENFIPADRAQFVFTPTVVNTGSEIVLFDTGLNAAGMTAALAAAGYTPDQIDTVIITHMHGDHIGGLTGEDGSETFANARYLTAEAEFDAWAAAGNDGFEAKVRPLAEKFSFLGDGDSAASGITAMAAFGHTPGHMVYMLDSGGAQLLIFADTANHYVWSLAYPEWEFSFDMDKAMAATSRRRILDMLATDRIPMIGYHMPFPGIGYVKTRDDGFDYEPASYQFQL